MNETNEAVTPVEGTTTPEATANVNEQEQAKETTTTRPRNDEVTFMTAWEETVAGLKNGTLTGSGVQIVADRLGIKKDSVSQRATNYRTERKIPLSKMPRGGGSRLDNAAAAELLAQIQGRLAEPAEGEETEADAEG